MRRNLLLISAMTVLILCGCHKKEASTPSATETEEETTTELFNQDDYNDNFDEEGDGSSTIRHLRQINVSFPTDYFDSSFVEKRDDDVVVLTASGSNAITSYYIAELTGDIYSGFNNTMLESYDELIKEQYGVSEHLDVTINDMDFHKYIIADNTFGYAYSKDNITLYIEIVSDGSTDAENAAISFISFPS